MNNKIYTFQFDPDWRMINQLTQIDRFGGSWSAIEMREKHSLKELKSMATVRSVGASTRIEGSKITDDEVEVMIKNLDVSKLEDRDQQEVAGYFETLDVIGESFRDLDITENNIKQLHHILMKYSEKDAWHKGGYKQQSNVVEATNQDGSKYIVFQTTNPGIETEDAMRKLIEWFQKDKETHPIVRSALFVYDFLSIHPFQDGNGRLSRLLATLLLLRNGYSWIQYVSFEHEIENRKGEYYKVLMQCQKQRPGEDVLPWVIYFLDCLNNIQAQLMTKLETKGSAATMSSREKKIFTFIEAHPGSKSGEIAERIQIPLPTVKRILADMLARKHLAKHGIGAGTNYVIENAPSIKTDLAFKLTNRERSREFLLMNSSTFLEIKKIILTPLFGWGNPDEWNMKLMQQGLMLLINLETTKRSFEQTFSISGYVSPNHYQPVFTLSNPINIPSGLSSDFFKANEYPIKATVALSGSAREFLFDVMLVYDTSIA